MANRKVLGISIDGVLRDMHDQFDTVYRKKFIKNDSLVQMDDKYQFVESAEPTEEDIQKIENLIKEKIHLPVDTYDLLNHYYFESKEEFVQFFENYSFEIFGGATPYPRVFDTINRLQTFGDVNNFFDVVIISTEKDKAIAATFHFLAKGGCKIQNIKFINEYYDKWNFCDVVIDDCPAVFENKPEGKISIKINHDYNVYSESDYSFNSINEVYNDMFLLKLFSPTKYLELQKNK